jgi:hypothetical protein
MPFEPRSQVVPISRIRDHEPRLVREDDRLDAVAQAELQDVPRRGPRDRETMRLTTLFRQAEEEASQVPSEKHSSRRISARLSTLSSNSGR